MSNLKEIVLRVLGPREMEIGWASLYQTNEGDIKPEEGNMMSPLEGDR